MPLWCADNWDSLLTVLSIILFVIIFIVLVLLPFILCNQFSGAIAISGGRFSEASVSILVGSVECNGSESGLLECAHVTGNDEAVTQCDRRESAAVACQSKLGTIMLSM